MEESRSKYQTQEKKGQEMIEQEIDGMWAVDGFSEPMTDLDFNSEQPEINA
jgi:hypothetical protein